MPVIGFVSARSAEASVRDAAAFHKGLSKTGYVEGQNVAVEYHWLDGQFSRLPSLMTDLVRRRVAVIATPNNAFCAAAKAATTTIPIVFGVAEDAAHLGLVARLARPGGNATGINFFPVRLLPSGWTPARLGAQGRSDCCAGQSGQYESRRGHVTRDTRSCTRPRPANSVP